VSAFSDLLDAYCARILAREPMAVYRFGDGERMLMLGKSVGRDTQAASVDRWQAKEGLSALGRDLQTVIESKQGHFGISCPCCDSASYEAYASGLQDCPTFPANLFINANYFRWRVFLPRLSEVPVAVVRNTAADSNKLPFPVQHSFAVPDDCVNWYENKRTEVSALIRQFARELEPRTVVLVAAGPLSEALIFFMWNENPNNTYVDVGSSLDEMLYGYKTRPYMDITSLYAAKECSLPVSKTSRFLTQLAGDDVSQAISAVEKVWGFGGWSLSKSALTSICEHMPADEVRILELGGGSSTLFWDRLSCTRNLRVTTVEHDDKWAADTRTHMRSSSVRVVSSRLKQLTDEEVAMVFETKDASLEHWGKYGQLLGPERNSDWTIRNTFYTDAHLLGLQDATIDVLVVDGPHGSGRSLAFPLFRRALKPHALILIDDFDHYPFLHDLVRTMTFTEIARGVGSKRWTLVRRTG
jgi:hypothetical protein